MCEHEGEECRRSCRCECMNCMFPEDEDSDGGNFHTMGNYRTY